MIFIALLGVVAFGALLGGIIGGIVTGDWIYTIVWAVALSVFVICAVLVALMALQSGSRVRPRWGVVSGGVLVVGVAVFTLVPAFGAFARIGTNQSLLTGAYQ